MKKNAKWLVLGAVVVGAWYYMWNKKHESKEVSGELPADNS